MWIPQHWDCEGDKGSLHCHQKHLQKHAHQVIGWWKVGGAIYFQKRKTKVLWKTALILISSLALVSRRLLHNARSVKEENIWKGDFGLNIHVWSTIWIQVERVTSRYDERDVFMSRDHLQVVHHHHSVIKSSIIAMLISRVQWLRLSLCYSPQ